MKIQTIYGELEERELERRVSVCDDEYKRTHIVEYYLAGVQVHRSAHVTLKQGYGLDTLGAF